VTAQQHTQPSPKSMKGVKIMDVSKYVSTEQVAELKAISKVMEQLKTMEPKSIPLDLSSFTVNPALLTRAF
jgi:hypothetical protein